MLGRRLLIVAIAPYVAWIVFAYDYHFLDGVNLAFHEAGHLFFGIFGQTLHFLGGTIAQILFPVACALHFLQRQQQFEAAICTVWLAESLMYVAHYLGDAQAQALPLVGGHIHDWHWLLSRAGLLGHCEAIAAAVHLLASGFAVLALAWAWRGAARDGDAEACERALA
jgi:hypothetical protein